MGVQVFLSVESWNYYFPSTKFGISSEGFMVRSTFNRKFNIKVNEIAFGSRPTHAPPIPGLVLNVIWNLLSDNNVLYYCFYFNLSVFEKILAHAPGDIPMVEQKGILLSTKTETQLAMTMRKVSQNSKFLF